MQRVSLSPGMMAHRIEAEDEAVGKHKDSVSWCFMFRCGLGATGGQRSQS